jgi:hypothetical protein
MVWQVRQIRARQTKQTNTGPQAPQHSHHVSRSFFTTVSLRLHRTTASDRLD